MLNLGELEIINYEFFYRYLTTLILIRFINQDLF